MTIEIDRPTGRRGARRRSRILTAFGLVLILTGLGFLGYVAWQYYGTNIIAKQEQNEVKAQIADDWGKGLDSDAIGLLRVERFGADYEMPILKGSDLLDQKGVDALTRGVAWYEKGAGPGEIGNFVVAGHRVTKGEPFRKFPDLRKGDRVEVETRTHIYVYELRQGGKDITVDFSTSWPLAPVPTPDAVGLRATEPLLTMVTCAELFHTRNRNVVIGDLVETIDKAAAPAS